MSRKSKISSILSIIATVILIAIGLHGIYVFQNTIPGTYSFYGVRQNGEQKIEKWKGIDSFLTVNKDGTARYNGSSETFWEENKNGIHIYNDYGLNLIFHKENRNMLSVDDEGGTVFYKKDPWKTNIFW